MQYSSIGFMHVSLVVGLISAPCRELYWDWLCSESNPSPETIVMNMLLWIYICIMLCTTCILLAMCMWVSMELRYIEVDYAHSFDSTYTAAVTISFLPRKHSMDTFIFLWTILCWFCVDNVSSCWEKLKFLRCRCASGSHTQYFYL